VVFTKNHDQIGNRMAGDRMSALVSFEGLKLHAAITLLSPFIPMIFMGEEYAEDVPFLYFVSHGDPDLIEAVRRGRKAEFEAFSWRGEPPDPQNVGTFSQSILHWEKRNAGLHRVMLAFYTRLLELRRENPVLSHPDNRSLEASASDDLRVLQVRRWRGTDQVWMLFNFNSDDLAIPAPWPEGSWSAALNSSDEMWQGPGSLVRGTIGAGSEVRMTRHSAAVFVPAPA
jgi:maltooligosyltrehalose trehalohydrolase